MRYIITESRLEDIFDRYMELTYDLKYYPKSREFKLPSGSVYGDLYERRFFYAYDSDEELLKGMFGNNTTKLLLSYLRNKFPELGIMGISNEWKITPSKK